MARLNNDIQQDEVRAYEQFCIAHNIMLDDSESAIANASLVRDYFTKTWNEVITAETLEKALPQLRSHLKFKSTARVEYEKVAAENVQAARQLVDWLNGQGKKPGQLVNQGDAAYENLTLLLNVLSGYDVNQTTISHAIDRISNRPGKKLQYIPAPRRTEPVSRAAKADDDYSPGKVFSSDMIRNSDGSLRSKTFHEQRQDREAKEAAEASSRPVDPGAAIREAKRLSEELRGANHSESDQLQRIFVTVGTDIDWIQTLASRQQMAKQFEKHRAVSRFIR